MRWQKDLGRTSKWDTRFMRIAKNEVATWSKDPRKKVGCVIVSSDMREMSTGYNGFPQGIKDTEQRLKDRDKLLFAHISTLTKKQLNKLYYLAPSPTRALMRSKTPHGLAQAIATQWGSL